MRTSEKYMAQGLCRECGKRPPMVTKEGKQLVRCAECVEKYKASQRKHDYMYRIDDEAQITKCLTCDLPAQYCKGEDCANQRRKWLEGKRP